MAKKSQFPSTVYIEEQRDRGEVFYVAHTDIQSAADLNEEKTIAIYKLVTVGNLVANAQWKSKLSLKMTEKMNHNKERV